MNFLADLKFALRSLARNKGLSLTVVATLALGIGANAAIFSVVRGVLLRPLVNRDESRLIYIRQSAPGLGVDNMVFSVPEIQDLRAGVKTISSFGEFSTIGFTMIGLGEPRTVRAGVVNGSYFDVMGLHPVLGRLLDEHDDGPNAAGAAVLTYRFWTTALHSDASVIGKTVRLGTRSATIVGVLEPSVPYPSETELIANVVTSPHHLSATMITGRVHRMTEVFGRLAPRADLDAARAELKAVHAAMVAQHPEAYSKRSNPQINAVLLRDQITSNARTVLLVLLAASGLVFIIAVSNVANLILARTVRREGELSVRAALGASRAVLRRTLLAESMLLCGTGALLGVLIAQPMVSVLARYAARFSVRALDLTLDASVLWVGVGLALAASVLLAFVPRLPAGTTPGAAPSGVRITGSTNRRLRAFAVTQIAASFVLLAGAGMLLKTLIALQATQPGFRTHNVLAVNVPIISYGRTNDQVTQFYREVQRQVAQLPGIVSVASASQAPWRDAGNFSFTAQFTVEGFQKQNGEDDPRARFRSISPGYFATLGVPLSAGRDFLASDDGKSEKVVIISQSVAQTLFPGQDPINRHLMWTDPVMKFIDVSTGPRRIVGVVPDIDDEHLEPKPVMAVYHPVDQEFGGGRLLVQTAGDPYALVPAIARTIRDLSKEQPVERAATLDDIKAEVLAPERLNTMVFGGFAIVALAISIVGVGGVLAFSVSGRTREFGIRLAVGSQPRRILTGVVTEGAVMAALGVAVGAAVGWAGARLIASVLQQTQMPGAVPIAGAAVLLVVAAVVASFMPAARAARVDVMQALRSE
ncbi:MAG TPA: ABC transporter permease [Vicinamibacterales bacterium]|nr:ABC transporter permease [Vicinamibacterales bacterium]